MEEIEGTVRKERHELKTKGKLIMESSLSALTLAAIIGASARAPLISGMVKLNPRVEFIRSYWERGRRKSKFTEGGLGAPVKSEGKRRRRRRRRMKGKKKKRGTG